MQGCAKKIKKIEEKMTAHLNTLQFKGLTLEGCRRTVTIQIQAIFIIWIVYTMKVIVLY